MNTTVLVRKTCLLLMTFCFGAVVAPARDMAVPESGDETRVSAPETLPDGLPMAKASQVENAISELDFRYGEPVLQDPATDYAAFKKLKRNGRAMQAFLKENDVENYRHFRQGVKRSKTGNLLYIPGIGATAAGVCLMFAGGMAEPRENNEGRAMVDTGLAFFAAGAAIVGTSIMLTVSGSGRKRHAIHNYEKKYFGSAAGRRTSLEIGITGNGVMLAVRF